MCVCVCVCVCVSVCVCVCVYCMSAFIDCIIYTLFTYGLINITDYLLSRANITCLDCG